MQSRIRAISKVFDLPEDTKYKSAALAIRDQSLIELDEMPSKLVPELVGQVTCHQVSQ